MVRAFYFLNKNSQAFNTQNSIKIILRGIFTFFACCLTRAKRVRNIYCAGRGCFYSFCIFSVIQMFKRHYISSILLLNTFQSDSYKFLTNNYCTKPMGSLLYELFNLSLSCGLLFSCYFIKNFRITLIYKQ
jgi:hypothetical protein